MHIILTLVLSIYCSFFQCPHQIIIIVFLWNACAFKNFICKCHWKIIQTVILPICLLLFVWKQNMHYTYNITLWCVCVTIVEEEMQQCSLHVLLSCMAWSKIQKHWELHNNNTYLGLHVKCLTLLSNFNQIWIFLTDFDIKFPIPNFMEIYPVGATLMYADIWTRWC